jgi:two-component system, LytTR family, sensor kinase
MSMGPRIRFPLLLITAFWVYVSLSDLLYANSMQWSLNARHAGGVFAPPLARLLQHLILYPVLLGCARISLRAGWRPPATRVLLQVLLGAVFAVLAYPAMALALWLVGEHSSALMHQLAASGEPTSGPLAWKWLVHIEMHIWLATTTTFFLAYGFGLALLTGFDVYSRLRDAQTRSAALERALSAAHLASLRMQLSPHSLFNLLHTIHGQIDWDPAAARTMIVQLGDLLRRLLNAGEREYSRLADEMQFARLYLELQQQRFADRLTVAVPPPAALPAAWVPSLILQPLIENAVVHGLAGHQGPVRVEVTASVSHGVLTLRVTNTLSGEPGAREGGIGLRNVRDRLAIQFAGRATFTAAPDGHGQWVAEIRMPCLADVLAPAPAAIAEPG